MPPKAQANDGVDSSKADVTVLCHILMTATDIKLDNKALAPILGLLPTSAKNVPRSLNRRLKPYGFEYKQGKIVSIGQEPGGVVPPAAPDSEPSTPAPKTKAPKTKTPASKKRKIQDTAMESNDASVAGEGGNSDNEA